MGLISIGDLAQSFLLKRHNVALKSELQHLSGEITTGRVRDVAARLSGDLVPLSGLDASLASLRAYRAVNSEAALFTGVMQTALGRIDSLSLDLSKSLNLAGTTPSPIRLDAVAAEARRQFEAAVATLNTRFGDRSIFAGNATNAAAVIDSAAMLSAVEAAASGAVSAADVEAAVGAWFDAPAGYAASAYLGGAALSPWRIAQGEQASADITAMDPAVRDTLKGLAMAALLDRGILAGQPEARQDLARRAGASLMTSQSGRVLLAARLGTVEAQIEGAAVSNAAEASSLEIARAGMIAADPYETASKLEQTQTQLETIYAITARMTRLSLMDFLR